MSRYSGCYVGLKCITDTLDLTATIKLPDPHRVYQLPSDHALPADGLNLKQNQPALVEEDKLVNLRLPAATAFASANGIARDVVDGERSTLGNVSAATADTNHRPATAAPMGTRAGRER